MKQNDLIVIALAGVAVLLIVQTTKAKTAGPTAKPGGTGTGATSGTVEIFNAQGLPFDNGWRYYSDGTSIGPDGAYYFGGQKVWQP